MTQQHEPFDWNAAYDDHHDDCHEADRLVLATVAELPTPGHALDVGCGAGSLLFELAQKGWGITGIDIAKTGIRAARKRLAEVEGAELHVADASKWTPERTYDLITNCFALPQTQADQQAALRMMQSALAPGGTLILKDFDAAMARYGHFAGFHMPAVDELTAPLDELEIVTAEVVDTPVHRKAEDDAAGEAWTACFIVARRPA